MDIRCEILGNGAATSGGDKYLLLTLRMSEDLYDLMDIVIPLWQARERLQVDLANLLKQSPAFNEKNENSFSEDP